MTWVVNTCILLDVLEADFRSLYPSLRIFNPTKME